MATKEVSQYLTETTVVLNRLRFNQIVTKHCVFPHAPHPYAALVWSYKWFDHQINASCTIRNHLDYMAAESNRYVSWSHVSNI